MASETRELIQMAFTVAGAISVPVVIAVIGTNERNKKAANDAGTADEKQLREDVKSCREELRLERETATKLRIALDEQREKNVTLSIELVKARANLPAVTVETVNVNTFAGDRDRGVTVEGNNSQ